MYLCASVYFKTSEKKSPTVLIQTIFLKKKYFQIFKQTNMALRKITNQSINQSIYFHTIEITAELMSDVNMSDVNIFVFVKGRFPSKAAQRAGSSA
jgi:hypothetical protein